MHCKPNEQQEKPRGSKAAGSPWDPREAVAVRVPIPPQGQALAQPQGSMAGGPIVQGSTALPWGSISGPAALPSADESGPRSV